MTFSDKQFDCIVQGVFDDRMLDALQGDASGTDWQEQLRQQNLSPQDVMTKIMSDPELAQVCD